MDELRGRLLAGTQRRAGPWQDPLFSGLEGSPERQLLSACALAAVASLAGRLADVQEALPADPQHDPRPLAPDGHLRRLLEGEFREVLPEWLQLCAERGYRIPPYHLPPLLDLAMHQRPVRPALARAAGPRALWLAQHHRDWRYLLAEAEGPEVWDTGTPTVRADWLRRLRHTDPESARQHLEASWSRESAGDKVNFLGALGVNLSLADEPFLLSARQDRARSVREAAAQLLLALPGSQLQQRWAERARQWVRLVPKTQRLALDLPREASAEMQADGLVLSSPERALGDRAWWLCQAVSFAPLAVWGEPDPWLEAAAQSEWREALLRGWQQAAVRQCDARWSAALLRRGASDPALFSCLARHEREGLLLSRLEPSWLVCHSNYSETLSARVWQQLQQLSAGPFRHEWSARFPALALLLPPRLPALAWPVDAPGWPHWEAALEPLLDRLTFRQSMHEEMQPR